MVRLLFLSVVIFIFLVQPHVTFAARPGGTRTRPELPHDKPGPVPPPSDGDSPPLTVNEPPFSDSESSEKLADLADKIVEMIESIVDLFSDSSTSSMSQPAFSVATATSQSTLSPSLASLGCEIQSSYNSICPTKKATPSTFTLGPLTRTIDSAHASADESTRRASCLCYSSSFFVPAIYDNAVWACGQINTGTISSTSAVSTAVDGEIEGFCYSLNVRTASSAYPTTTTTTPIASITSTATVSSTGNPTPTASQSSAITVRFLGAKRAIWVCVGSAVIAAFL